MKCEFKKGDKVKFSWMGHIHTGVVDEEFKVEERTSLLIKSDITNRKYPIPLDEIVKL